MAVTNLAELAEASAERLGEQSCLEIEGEQFTNWQILDRGRCLQAAMAELGLARGGRAVVLMMNHALVYSVFQGIFRAGGTAIPVMPQAAAAELRYILADTEAQLVITDADRLSVVREAVAGLDHVRHILVQGGVDNPRRACRDRARRTLGLQTASHFAANRRGGRGRNALFIGHHRQAQGSAAVARQSAGQLGGRVGSRRARQLGRTADYANSPCRLPTSSAWRS